MNKNFYISVIIPVYNVQDYLSECLDSVLAQNIVDNIEIICVNDGSTDSSLDILKEYKAKFKNFILVDQENGGLSKARNSGLKVASGEYICFLDSDDFFIGIDNLERLYLFAKNNNLDLLNFNYVEILENKIKKRYLKRPDRKIFTGKDFLANFSGDFDISACTKLYLKKYIDKIGFSFKEGIIYEDLEVLIKTYRNAHRVAYRNLHLYAYRIREQSTMTNKVKEKNIFSMLEVVKSFIASYNKETNEQFKRFIKSKIYRYLLSTYELIYLDIDKSKKYLLTYEKVKFGFFVNKKDRFFLDNEEKYILNKQKGFKWFMISYWIRKLRKRVLFNG